MYPKIASRTCCRQYVYAQRLFIHSSGEEGRTARHHTRRRMPTSRAVDGMIPRVLYFGTAVVGFFGSSQVAGSPFGRGAEQSRSRNKWMIGHGLKQKRD